MSRMPLPRPLLVLALAAVLAAPAQADDVLKLRSGDLVPGKVLSVDDEGVNFAPSKGGEIRVRWEKVHPINRYELWKVTLAPEDPEGRVTLAEWCLSADLFLYARRELAEARGLGYAGGKDLGVLLETVHRAEADRALLDVDELVAKGEYEEALERITRYVRVADSEEHEKRVRDRVPDLVARIERRDALAQEQKEKDAEEAKTARRDEWVRREMEKATGSKASGRENAVEGFGWLEKGNQTRARDRLAKAEKDYDAARKILSRVRRAVGAGETAEVVKRELDDCDRALLEVLLRWGALEVDNKSWKRASAIVDRGLKIDPVHHELQRLRRVIDENWIRRKASDITGATGHSSSGF